MIRHPWEAVVLAITGEFPSDRFRRILEERRLSRLGDNKVGERNGDEKRRPPSKKRARAAR